MCAYVCVVCLSLSLSHMNKPWNEEIVILEDSQAHLIMYCPWLLLHYNGRVE